jgi:fatty acid desaturase
MALKTSKIRARTNLSIGIVLVLINLCFFLVLPYLTTQPIWLVLLALVNALLSTPYWSLIHEAIHHIYHPNKKINNFCGRAMTILFGSIFAFAQYGHLMHHRMNRQGPDLVDAYDPKHESFWKKSLQYYLHIFGGLYLFEVIAPLLTFFPRKWLDKLLIKSLGAQSPYYLVAKRKLLTPKGLREMRIDAIFLYLLLVTSFILYGQHAWILIFGLLLRGFFISFADNLPHYRTPTDQPRYAYNTYLPPALRLFWLNFNLHRVHHAYPNLPWHMLHQTLIDTQDKYDIAYFKQAIYQLKGVWVINEDSAPTTAASNAKL